MLKTTIALFVAAPVVVVVISSMMQSSSSLAYTARRRRRRQRHRIGGQWGGQTNAAFARTHTEDDRVGTVKLEQRHPRMMFVSNIMSKRSLLTAMEGTNGNDDEFDASFFDPFLQSPLSFGETTTTTTTSKEEEAGAANDGRNFGFLTYAENHVGSTAATTTSSMQFDPLLSPHVYTNGIDAGPSMQQPQQIQQQQKQQKRLGIILIDHGSKRQASNDHIHKIAQMYEQSLQQQLNSPSSSSSKSNNNIRQLYSGGGGSVIVKAAHMEIASPSILDTIRDIIISDQVTSIICVPYFLSPGRHATEDVPELINEAREVLRQEGLLTLASRTGAETADDDDDDDGEISIIMSDALGTHLVGMLSVVDDLVVQTLNNM